MSCCAVLLSPPIVSTAISMAIQRGNALAMLSGHTRACARVAQKYNAGVGGDEMGIGVDEVNDQGRLFDVIPGWR